MSRIQLQCFNHFIDCNIDKITIYKDKRFCLQIKFINNVITHISSELRNWREDFDSEKDCHRNAEMIDDSKCQK